MKTLRPNKLLILMISLFAFTFLNAQDNVTISLSANTVSENVGTVTVTATVTSGNVADNNLVLDVNDLGTGTAVAGTDYTAFNGNQITIPIGSTIGTLDITITNDNIYETPDETIDLSVTYNTGGTGGVTGVFTDASQTITIVDNDVKLSVSANAMTETGGSVTLTATSGFSASGDLTVTIGYGGTATDVSDYVSVGTITILNGATTGTAVVNSVSDALLDPAETIVATITNVTQGQIAAANSETITITDDDVALSVSANAMNETGGSVTLTATSGFSAAGDLTVTIGYGGTATNVTDYTQATTITIPNGVTTGTATVSSVTDILLDPAETIIATITAVSQGQIATANSETIIITDDEDQSDFISAPINGLTGVEIEPGITWADQAGDANGYNVFIATSGTSQTNFEANITASNLADGDVIAQNITTYEFDEINTNIPLSNNTTYYLQVVSRETADLYHYSNIYHFTTFPDVSPTLTNPANGTTVYTADVLFGWTINQAVGTMSFKLQVQETALTDNTAPTVGEWAADGSGTDATSYTTANLSYSVTVNAGRKFYWRVIVLDENSDEVDYSTVYAFTTSGGATVDPIPSYPIGGATVYSNAPTLYWYLSTYASGVTYQVRYGTSSTDTTPADGEMDSGTNQPLTANIATATSALYATLPTLTAGTTYYWQVRSYYAATGEYGDWSSINSFVTHGTGTLVVPKVSYPTGGVTVYTTSPYLYWYLEDSGLGLTYNIEVDDDVAFGSADSYTSTTVSVQATTALTPGTTYYWRVESNNGTTTSNWSNPVGSFVVAGGNANTYPVATYPTSGATVLYTNLPSVYWYLEGSSLEVDGYVVKYSTTNLGAGWAASLGAPDATDGQYTVTGASTTYKTFTTALTYGETYYWAVCAVFDGVNGTTYGTGAFTVVGPGTEGIPVLSTPENNATVYSDDVTLYWYINGSSTGIASYNIIYSESDVWASSTTTNSTTQSLALTNLNPGSTYYWKVQSVYSDGTTSNYSSGFHFTIDAGSNAVTPFPGSPINNVAVNTTSPVVSWVLPVQSESVLTYELEYSTSADFSDAQVLPNVENPYIALNDLAENQTYYWRVKSSNNNGSVSHVSPIGVFNTDGVTGIEENTLPTKFEVSQNYPNPFNPTTTIKYQLPDASNVSIKIYDVLGNEVKTLVNNNVAAGYHSVVWNADNNAGQKVSSGVYFYRVVTNSNSVVKKMLLMK